MFQQSRLFKNLSVKENLLLAIDNEDTKFWKNLFGLNKITKEKEEKIREMLKLVEMERFENRLVGELSFGQKRLIELVRTILNPHELLMLDEPVAGVNPRLRKIIARILLKLKKQGKTILLIEHDMNFALSLADEVIVMDEGKVIAKGKPKEIKNNPKVLEAYLGD
jgi:ABC-type branched-subunit amino acid transport system ATPase component